MKKSGLLILAVAPAVVAACLAATRPGFESNFSSVRVADDHLIEAATGQAYSGTLVARDAEINAIGAMVLGDTPLKGAATADTRGLILVMPVVEGVPSGRAKLYADLRSPALTEEVTRRRGLLAVARHVSPVVQVGEAVFEDGKLQGTAKLMAPASESSTRLSVVAEMQFRDNLPHGVARKFYPGTTQIRREVHFVRGVLSGAERKYYPSGALERERTYLEGKRHGETTEYYESGALRARYSHDRGEPVGKSEAWFPTGQLRQQIVRDDTGVQITRWYSNGKLAMQAGPAGKVETPPDGLIVDYYPSGRVKSRTRYVNGVQHGAYEVLYSNGKAWERGSFDGGKQSGSHRKWWKNGRLALDSTWVAGVLDGPYRRWYANGTLWEKATYRAGKRIGRYQKWWKNGAIAHDYRYKDGKLHGPYRTFYDNGAKWAVGHYADGKSTTTMKRWFPDGRLGYIMHFKDGRPHGPYKRWWADGTLRLDAMYVDGKLHGDFKNWLEDGSVYELATYRHGKKIKTTLEQKSARVP